MEALAGPYYAAALLVAAAGVAKIARPAAATAALRAAGLPGHPALVRSLGVAEIAVAGFSLAGGRAGALALAGAYVGFAAFSLHAAGRAASCGCFGATRAPLGALHVTTNLALAALAAAIAVAPLPGISGGPAAALPLAVLSATTAYLLYLTMTRFAELRSLVRR